MEGLSPLVAFAGGLLSFLSPCILPLIPVYIASISSPAIIREGSAGRRLTVFLHSLSFVFGFSIVFTLLGVGAGFAGLSLGSHSILVRWAAGGFLVFFGVFMIAAARIPWLNYEKRLNPAGNLANGYLRAFIIGMLFTLAWTPCVGPVLGGILTLALNSQSAWQGGWLLVLYSLGIGLPFLALGLAFDSLRPLLKRLNRFSAYVYIISGTLLITVGVLILLNKLSWFSF